MNNDCDRCAMDDGMLAHVSGQHNWLAASTG
jgi:hypothetical protein